MSFDRPTFHESWHRVASLRPRLKPGARVYRQVFRGQLWHVVEDPSGARFFRLSESAWGFVGLLDGRRTTAQAWEISCGRYGDDAPTQGEAIQLLAQLYSSDLLQAELPGDTEALLRRRRRRIGREARGWLASIFFARVPLWDPDRFLDRWVPLVAWLFSPLGFLLWLALLGAGGWHLVGRERELASGFAGALSTDNLVWLYLCFALIKLFHELGHAFACKTFGRRSAGGGEVHTIGLMFLIFLPVPYVDASSSWALRSRLHRIIVAAAGVIVELAVAAVAAVIWARSAPGTLTHALAFNVIFIAGVSTVIFNANPLMRYDGYYVLSDLLGIPNLAQRGADHVKYLVKRFAWGVRRAVNPASAPGEGFWLPSYAVLSAVYRAAVYVAIMLYIADQQFVIGAAIILLALILWVAVPVSRFAHYLFLNAELERVRPRALLTTALVFGSLAVLLGALPLPDHVRATGIVEPARFASVFARTDGFITHVADSGSAVLPPQAGAALVLAENPALRAELTELRAETERLSIARRVALSDDLARVSQFDEQLAAIRDRIAWIESSLKALTVAPPLLPEGDPDDAASNPPVWICPDEERLRGAYMRRGQLLGMVADLSSFVVRAGAEQRVAALLIEEHAERADVRARSRPSQASSGRIARIVPAGSEKLPAESLAISSGGTIDVRPEESGEPRAAEPVFEVAIDLERPEGWYTGQRVEVRFRLADKPLLTQLWRSVRQTLQERFRV